MKLRRIVKVDFYLSAYMIQIKILTRTALYFIINKLLYLLKMGLRESVFLKNKTLNFFGKILKILINYRKL